MRLISCLRTYRIEIENGELRMKACVIPFSIHKIHFMKYLALLFLFLSCSLFAQDKIFISGCGWQQVVLIDKNTKQIEWSYDLDKSDDCENITLTKDGNLLISYKRGAKLINAKKEIIWDYKLEEKGELYAATQMSNGGFLLAHSGSPAKIIELDKKGKEIKKLSFNTGVENLHGQMRQLVKAKNGNYLFPIMAKAEVVEVSPNGTEVMRFKVEGNPFSIIELKNGNLLVACGDAHLALEVERRTGKLVRKIGQKDIEGVSLNFVAQIVEQDNDNLLICNWNGHAKGEAVNQPALIEITPDNKLIWQLSEGDGIGRISCVFPVKNKDLKKLSKYKNK